MQTLIIADTACLILFDKINEFDLLNKLFGEVTITTKIAQEFRKTTPDWVKIKDPTDSGKVVKIAQIVDFGEASAIALAIEEQNSLLILDDLKARQLSDELSL